MKLLTRELRKSIPALYETEGTALLDKIAKAKLFHPQSQWTWYIIESDGEDQCWGLVVGHEVEFGYFSINELQSVGEQRNTLPIERDMYFKPTSIRELRNQWHEIAPGIRFPKLEE